MLGYPGAGKTTAAESIARTTGAVHVSSDQVRRTLFPQSTFTQAEHDQLYNELDAQLDTLLRSGKSVVFDANLNRRQHRLEKYQLAKSVGAEPKLIWVKTPAELAKHRRVSHQPQPDLTPQDETPEKMFDRIAGLFEAPDDSESYIVLDGTKISDQYVKQQLAL